MDLSKAPKIIEIPSGLFSHKEEEVRLAGSISLGSMTVGNPDFFLQKVFDLLDKSQENQKYLFLYSIRDIIVHAPKCLKNYLSKLLPLLLAYSGAEDQTIRSLVTENIGRLFVVYSQEMVTDIEKGLKSKDALIRQTVTGSFRYGASKHTELIALEMIIADIAKLIPDKDVSV